MRDSLLSGLLATLLMTTSVTAMAAQTHRVDTLMRSIDQVNRFYVPGKTTHGEILTRLKDMGCHYRSNNRLLQDPTASMTNTYGWFYRLLPEDQGMANCFPVTVFFQNKDGQDVIEIDAGSNLDKDGLLLAMRHRWGEPYVAAGRGKEHQWLFKAHDRTIILKAMGFLRSYEIEIRPADYYDQVKTRAEDEKVRLAAIEAEDERRAQEAEAKRELEAAQKHEHEALLAKAHEDAEQHIGRLFGILTPGETYMELAEVEAEELGCRIEDDGELVRMAKDGCRSPCIMLPGHPRLSVEQFKGSLGLMVSYPKEGPGVALMRDKLSKTLGTIGAVENRGMEKHYWHDTQMSVVETGHHQDDAPITFFFVGKQVFDQELARMIEEKHEEEAQRKKEVEHLNQMF